MSTSGSAGSASTTTAGTTTSAGTHETTHGETGGSSDDESGSEDTTTGAETGEHAEICKEVVDWYVMCYPEAAPFSAALEAYCNSELEYAQMLDGPGCIDALEDLFACANQLGCEEDHEVLCSAEIEDAELACPTYLDDDDDPPPP